MGDLLEVADLSLRKGKEILKKVSFSLSKGEFLLILGPSGSGKSSLLRCLNRLETITGGTVSFEGQNALSMNVRELRRRIGMVFQTPALLPGSVRENLAVSARLRKQSLTEEDAISLLQKVGLSIHTLDRPVDVLSIGEQQRVALAQTLTNHPQVLMLDEPTSALDPTAVTIIEELIQSINRDFNTAILWVTHDVAQAVRFNAQTMVMIDGEIIAQGNIRELMASGQDPRLEQFFHGTLVKDPEINRKGEPDGK